MEHLIEIVTPAVSPESIIAERREFKTGPIDRWSFVDTSKVNSDVFLGELSGALAGGAPALHVRKDAPGYPLSPEELEQLAAQSDAVVVGFGDCGTSMSFAVRDAAALEQMGIAAVVVCSDAFSSGAAEFSGIYGVSSLPIVTLPHPLASKSPDAIRELARGAATDIDDAARRSGDLPDEEGELALPDRLHLAANPIEGQEELHRRGWTDGLPVVVPTPAAVAAMSEASGRSSNERMPPVPVAQTRTTLERWAANAVMAGCRPEHFATVLAAMEAVLDPEAELASSQVATNTSTPMLVINGPVRAQLGVESGLSCLGPGSRASATIGRAVRLILRNVGRELPGLTDLATHGQPGKFTYCFAENEEESPWEPWHVSRGFDAGTSTVTAVMASPPQNIFAYGCNNASDLMDHLISPLTALGHNNIMFDTGPILVLSPEHAHILGRAGYTRDDIQREVFERGRIPLASFPEVAQQRIRTRRARWFATTGVEDMLGVADAVGDVHVLVAGGAGIHSQFVSTSFSRSPVTKPVMAASAAGLGERLDGSSQSAPK